MDHGAVARLIHKHQRFLVSCHAMPDADAVGSMLAMRALLLQLGKTVDVYNPDPLPDYLDFLCDIQRIERRLADDARYDVTFVVDTAAPSLVLPFLPPVDRRGVLVVLDHHTTYTPYGDVELRDVHASATAEVVVKLSKACGLSILPQGALEPVYTAIVADTGGFRASTTNATTLRLAADLVELGVDPWRVSKQLFETWPRQRIALLSEVLKTTEFFHGGKLCVLTVTQNMLKACDANSQMVEGLVGYSRRITGVEIGALLSERDAGGTKLSLRARNLVDVSKLAMRFGGGGHKAAAGAAVSESLEVAKARLVDETRLILGG